MTVADDAGYLERWVVSLPDAVAVVRRAGVRDDFSTASVVDLWTWATGQFASSPATGPGPAVNDPLNLPEWAGRPGHHLERITMTASTLQLIAHLARYYGECIRARVPAAEWVIWRWKEPGSLISGEGDPALTVVDNSTKSGFRGSVFPIRDIVVGVQRVLSDSTEPVNLARIMDMRVADLSEASRRKR